MSTFYSKFYIKKSQTTSKQIKIDVRNKISVKNVKGPLYPAVPSQLLYTTHLCDLSRDHSNHVSLALHVSADERNMCKITGSELIFIGVETHVQSV